MKPFAALHVLLLLFLCTNVRAQEKEENPWYLKPAVKIKDISISPQSPRPGEQITILVTLVNQSETPTGNFYLQVMAEDEWLGHEQLILNSKSSKTLSFKWKAVNTGEINIKAIADPEGMVNEVDKSNNISELKLNITSSQVYIIKARRQADSTLSRERDILIDNISVQGHKYQPGKKRLVTINFRITNHSLVNIEQPFQTSVLLTDQTGFRKEFRITTSKLNAGQSSFASVSVQDAPHQFDISIIADPGNVIRESNKQNNTAKTFFENPAPPVNRWISAGPDYIKDVNDAGYPWDKATGLLSVMAINPEAPQTMYVGSPRCGIWKTSDAGTSWFPITDKIAMSVAALTLSPGNPDQLYWLTENNGIYVTYDAGMSWTQIGTQDLNAFSPSGKLLIHPREQNIMLVQSNDGVYVSTTGGNAWNLTLPGGSCTGLEILPGTDVIYAGIYSETNINAVGLYASYDRGQNWRKLGGCPGGSLPANELKTKILLAQSGSSLYVAYRTKDKFQLYRPTNMSCSIGGTPEISWERAWSTTDHADELWGQMWANPFNPDFLYLGGTAFWRSGNRGSSFSKVSDYGTNSGSAHADHHGFAALPGQPNTIFSLNDGGIYRSIVNGAEGSWQFIGQGISNVLFYDFADAFTKHQLLIGGTQDNGTIKTDANLTWTAKRGGDGATVDIDNTNENIMYSMEQYARSIKRSTNGGNNWSNIFNGLPDGSVCFNIRYHLHPRNMKILLAACTQLWRITDPAGSWQVLFTPPSGDVSCSAIEPSSDTYLAGTSNGKIFAGIGGSNFQEIFTHPSSTKVSDIECDPENPANIYAGFPGQSTKRIYLLKKNGSTYSATDITADLPVGVVIQCLAIDRMNDYTIYIGSTAGVYRGRSFNNGKTWQWDDYMDGLPLADIRDLEVHPVSGVLRAATFGRSLFEVSTDDPLGSVLSLEGKINFLRVQDADTKFGPPNDVLDAETIISLDTKPGHYFGFQLRPDANEDSHKNALESLRSAFESNLKVRIEYIRNGLHSGRILRVIIL